MSNKNKTLLAGALLLAIATMGGAGGAAAQTFASLPLIAEPANAVGAARALPAWTEFCSRHPAECAINRDEPEVMILSAKAWASIVAVNRRVNAEITPVTDAEHWGVPDRWDIPTDGSGDCEDYQLLKRKLLAEAGLPRRAMRVTVVIDEKNEGHAVLMIRTNRGDLVLDNKHDNVQPWFETGYTFVKRESADEIGWVSLGRAVSPVTTANRR